MESPDLPLSNVNKTETPRAELARAASEAAEGERRRLAQTLHDTVCQSLTGAYFHAQVVMKKLQGSCPEEAQQIGELAEMIHRAVVELGDISRGLQIAGRASSNTTAKP